LSIIKIVTKSKDLIMPRGGARKGAGKKTSWKSGCKFDQTKLIRVPITVSGRLLEIAHWLDEGAEVEKVTKPIQCELPIPPDTKSEIATNSKEYTETAFAQELGISRSTLKNRKKKYLDGLASEEDFYHYLREQDPQSRSWRYCRQRKRYYY
jgi:hypothetical protein